MIDLEALLRIPYVEMEMGYDISPDGMRVAFSWNPDGQWEIYELAIPVRLPFQMVSNQSPKLVSNGPGAKFNPRYSPDGKSIAFVVDSDGSENFHLIYIDLTTNVQKELLPQPAGTLQASFAWSPDSRQIAYISDHLGRFNVYALTIVDGKSRLILDVGYPAWKVSWSPDGNFLAITVEANGIDYGIFVVPVQGGQAERITDLKEPIDAGQANWSPDGRYLAFSSDSNDHNNIGIYDLSSKSISWLTEGEGEKQFPSWSPDGSRLTYVLNHGTVSWLVVQALGAPVQKFRVESGVHYVPRFLPGGAGIIFGFDNPCHPADLWLLSLDDGIFTQITHSLPEEFFGVPFIEPDEITYPGMDGAPVPALLFIPKTERPGPAVVFVHGGPDWFFEMAWHPIMAHMASRGWVVLAPNYRGSTGYGRKWQDASRFDFGGVDADDVAAGASYLVKAGLADPQRIAITGRSHGGYLTASCLTRYSDLNWAAGSAVVPFLNWFTNHNAIRPDLQKWDLENFGDPFENHDLWKQRSPIFFLENILAPVQLICGRKDVRCPASDSIEAEAVLRKMGKQVELIIYDDEGHSFLKIENLINSELRRMAFLANHLEIEENKR